MPELLGPLHAAYWQDVVPFTDGEVTRVVA